MRLGKDCEEVPKYVKESTSRYIIVILRYLLGLWREQKSLSLPRLSALGHGDTHSRCPVPSLVCNLEDVSDIKYTHAGADKNEVIFLLLLAWVEGRSGQKALDDRLWPSAAGEALKCSKASPGRP